MALDGGAGEQAARLRGVNTLPGEVLHEQAFDDVDLVLDGRQRLQRAAKFHGIPVAPGIPVILVHTGAHEEHCEALGRRSGALQRLQPRHRDGNARTTQNGPSGDAFFRSELGNVHTITEPSWVLVDCC